MFSPYAMTLAFADLEHDRNENKTLFIRHVRHARHGFAITTHKQNTGLPSEAEPNRTDVGRELRSYDSYT